MTRLAGNAKANMALVAARRALVMQLRNEGASPSIVLERVNSDPRFYNCKLRDTAAVAKDLKRALDDAIKEQRMAAEQYRQQELAIIDSLMSSCWQILRKRHLVIQGGNAIQLFDPETGQSVYVEDSGPALAAIKELRQLTTQRSKLTGTAVPIQVEASGQFTVIVNGVSTEELL